MISYNAFGNCSDCKVERLLIESDKNGWTCSYCGAVRQSPTHIKAYDTEEPDKLLKGGPVCVL